MAVAGRMPKGRSHNVGGYEHDGVGTETGAAAGTQGVTPCFRTTVFGLKSPAQLQIEGAYQGTQLISETMSCVPWYVARIPDH